MKNIRIEHKKVRKFNKLLAKNVFFTIIISIILQAAYLMMFFFWLGDNSKIATMIFWFLTSLALMLILRFEPKPEVRVLWLFVIGILPVLGGVFYIMIGGGHAHFRPLYKRLRLTETTVYPAVLTQDREVSEELREKDPALAAQAEYLIRSINVPLCRAGEGDVKYYGLGEEMFPDMCVDIRRAKKYVFVEYFIIEYGIMWDTIFDLLLEKKKEGVDVRVLYDDVGSMTTVPRSFARQIREYGIPCISFNRFFPILSAMMNNRDHRKILVVDGKVGYTGGINLADEYINRKKRFGVWKDTGVRVKGEAAWSLTVMFLQMWAAAEVNEKKRYLRDREAPWGIHPVETVKDILAFRPDDAGKVRKGEGDGYLQPYFDTPLDRYHTGEDVYLNIINTCTDHLFIATPYLLIDSELTGALRRAARRGVKVTIIMPGIPDKKLIYTLSHSYYAPLLEAGVEILEYTPGFVHAKVFEADGKIAVVGSVNMDFRALSMHFECGCILYEAGEIRKIREDMEKTAAQCRPVALSECRYGFFRNAALAILQTLAPVL